MKAFAVMHSKEYVSGIETYDKECDQLAIFRTRKDAKMVTEWYNSTVERGHYVQEVTIN